MREKIGEAGLVWRVRSDADRQDFMKTLSYGAGGPGCSRVGRLDRTVFKMGERDRSAVQGVAGREAETKRLLFLRTDQAGELLRSAVALREKLIVRYFMLNGLSPFEVWNGRLEHLDPVNCTLYLPRRHWKRNCLADIDEETVRLQVLYAGDREQGPLILSRRGCSLGEFGLWKAVKRIAMRTRIPGKEEISPLVLKRTFAREWLLAQGCIGSLQKQFSHKHLWSTAHYLRFIMDDVKPDHARMIAKLRTAEPIKKRGER